MSIVIVMEPSNSSYGLLLGMGSVPTAFGRDCKGG